MLNGAHGIFGTPDGDILLAEGNPSRITRLRLQSARANALRQQYL
jgi:peptidylglycine monooxygenase